MSVHFQSDRHDLASLHALSNGTGQNALASSSRMPLTQGPWKKAPTRIPLPDSNRRSPPQKKKPSGASNPYSEIRNDNLSAPRSNPSARSLVPISGHAPSTIPPIRSDKPAHKKPRLETEQSMNRRGNTRLPNSGKLNPSMSASTSLEVEEIFSSSKSGGKTPRRRKRTRGDPPSRPDICEVIDLDEDLGEAIAPPTSESSDDLRLHEGERPGQDPIGSLSIQTILETNSPSPQHPFNRKEGQLDEFLPPPTGPQTGALKVKIDAQQRSHVATFGNESDPIEDPDDTEDGDRPSPAYRKTRKATPSGVTDFPVNSVRNAVEDINRKGGIPQVDLSKTQKSRIGGMKPKSRPQKMMEFSSGFQSTMAQGQQRKPRKQLEESFMAPSGFQPNDKHHRLDKQLMLPIEKWIFGSNIINSTKGSQHWLSVRNDRVSIMIRKADLTETPLFELLLIHDIAGISTPRDYLDDTTAFAQLKFCVRRTEKSIKLFVNKEKDAKSLDVFVKFSQSDSMWSPENYDGIIHTLQASSVSQELVDSHARRSQWQGLEPEATQVDISIFFTPSLRDRPKPRPANMGSSEINPSDQRRRDTSPSSQPFLRRSTRNLGNVSQNSTRSPPADETILLFPPTGTGAVNVMQSDLKRLEPGEYLNDTLIELGLKLWLQDLKSSRPELAEQVHVFSSFFYTQLNHKNVEEGYQSVRKWTSRFDLFRKKYIIIPINEHMHWYLAIICYPDRVLCQQTLTQPIVPNVTTRNRRQETLFEDELHGDLKAQGAQPAETPHPMSISSKSVAGDEQEVEMLVNTGTIPSSPSQTLAADSPQVIIPETECGDEQNFSDISMKRTGTKVHSTFPTSHGLGTVPTTAFYASPDVKMRSVSVEKEMEEGECNDGMEVDDPVPALEPEKAEYPYIFSFDSLGSRHPHALKLLSRYLELEAMDKKHLPQTTPAITKQASVPTQSNYCDCGVYLLHFVERFMSDPEDFVSRIACHAKSKKSADIIRQERETMWNHSVVESKRESLKHTVMSLSSNWKRGKEVEDKEKPEDDPCKTHSEGIAIDNDSDIEVLELSPEPIKTVSSAGPQIPRQYKANRIR